MVILRQSVSCNLRHAVMKKFSFNCLFVLLACTSCVTFSSALDSGLQYHTTSDGILHDSGCTKCCDIPYQSSNILQDIKSCSGPYFFVGVQAQPSIYEFGAFAAAMEMKTETKIERPYNFLYSAPDASFPLLDAAFLDQQNLDVSLRTQNSKLPLEWTRTIFSCPGLRFHYFIWITIES